MKLEKFIVIAIAFFVLEACTCANDSHVNDDTFIDESLYEVNTQDYADNVMAWDGPLCGNGIVEQGEECDDGNRLNCDDCSMSCKIEYHSCDTILDAFSEGDAEVEDIPPAPPEPTTALIKVESGSDPSDSVDRCEMPLNVIWTGSFFSVVYFTGLRSLGMKRFDTDGIVIGRDWIYNPVEELGITAYDFCWNGHDGFGLAWVEGLSAYFMRLNADGKPIAGPVRVCDNCLTFFGGGIPILPIRVACKNDGFLLSYHVEVEYFQTYTWLQPLDAIAEFEFGEGTFLGQDDTHFWLHAGGLVSFDQGWLLLHSSDMPEVDPEQRIPVILEGISGDFEFLWRSTLSLFDGQHFDFDTDENQAFVVFPEEEEKFYLARIALDDGSLESINEVEKALRVEALTNGNVAVLKDGDGVFSCHLAIINEHNAESESVFVDSIENGGCYHLPFDLAWTGSEIGVIISKSREDSILCDFYLQMFQP